MTTDNGQVQTEELAEMELGEIPVAALENVVLELPDDYQDEIYATQLLEAITQYHTFTVQYRALRNQGDHSKADQAAKIAATCRAQAALIQYEHPNTILLYKKLANLRALETRGKRDTAFG